RRSGAEGRQLGRPQDPLYQGGEAVLQGPDADRLGSGNHDAPLSRYFYRRDGPGGPDGNGVPFRRFHRTGTDRHGDDAERLRQFEFLAAGRENPGQYRRLSDAAVVDGGIDRGAGRGGGDPRVPGRV